MRDTTSLVPESRLEDATHLVLNDFGRLGKAYVETDPAAGDRETIIQSLLSGQYDNPIRVVAFNVEGGWSRDVSEDIAREVVMRAGEPGCHMAEATMGFIERYCGANVV
jgi:hypothetical protein